MKPRLLDLFCGAGGASMGYYRAGFQPYGIDNKPQPHYPFPFLQMDALEAMDRLLRGEGLTFSNGETLYLKDFEAYHASPPCQAYLNCNKGGLKETKHPRLIEPSREILQKTDKPFVIENIHKAPLNAGLMLCGTMFNLRVIRHRYFEFNFAPPLSPFHCNHWGSVARGEFVAVYDRGGKGPRYIGGREPKSWKSQVTPAEAMGIKWMTFYELTQAIPPSYTEYIGKYLLQAIEKGSK